MAARTLVTGTNIPRIAFGVGTAWYGRSGVNEELVNAVLTALKTGYTHLDLAEGYGNEKSVGEALKRWDGDRDQLYITEKISGGSTKDIEGTLRRQLKDLGIQNVDMYLLHSPDNIWPSGSPKLETAWQNMEKLLEAGLTKAIGVSNHRVQDIDRILSVSKTRPAVNQIEYHPYIRGEAQQIVDHCQKNGILVEAYSPTATIVQFPGGPADNVVNEIADRTNSTPGQVVLKWALAKVDYIVTTSGKESRMKEQLAILDSPDLSKGDIEAIDAAGAQSPPKRRYMTNVFQ